MKLRSLLTLAVGATLILLATAPAVADEPAGSASIPSDGTPTVNVTLSDMRISMDRTSVPAGPVIFSVTNSGTITHELVLLRTDLATDKIPMDVAEPGKVSEDANIGETGDIVASHFSGLAITLKAGKYVLICNEPGHYAAGMRVPFTVTAPNIEVSLQDMSIKLSRTSVLAGPVTFSVTNSGVITHEFVLLRTDLATDKIPMDVAEPGKVSEDANIGETGDIVNGHFSGLAITLQAGKYVLICNEPGHYTAGMRVAFTVLPAPPDPEVDLGNDYNVGGDED